VSLHHPNDIITVVVLQGCR